MRSIRYFDFDLLIEPGEGSAHYEARVLNAPSGQYAPVEFTVPFSDLELENFLLKIGRRRNAVRGLDTQEATTVREFGSRLFDSLFAGELRVALATSLSETDSDDLGLRVRLRLSECPELADLPWEYLYDKTTRRFLALSEWTPLVRYLDLPGRVRPLTVDGPLRILGMVSSPTDYPRLDVHAEWAKLQTALSALEADGRVELSLVPDGTFDALHRELRRADFHVFHYIGHGGFRPNEQDGVLVLEDGDQRGLEVSGQDLGVSLHDHRTLRLAVLNSCEGARTGLADPYSGTAQTLVQQGIPAVIAMQFEISDEAAIQFSQILYESIADGYPLDASMAEARKAVRSHGNATEWGTPVLYLRAPDGRIFDMTRWDPSSTTPPTDVSATSAAGSADSAGSPTAVAPAGDEPAGRASDDYPAADVRPTPISVGPEDRVETVADADEADDVVAQTAPPPSTQPTPQPTLPEEGDQIPPSSSDLESNETTPPGDGGHRGKLIGAIAGIAVVVIALVAFLIVSNGGDTGNGNGGGSASMFDPTNLSAAAAPLFDPSSCSTPSADEVQFASTLPLSQLLACPSSSTPYTGLYWCAGSSDDFNTTRGAFLGEAADKPVNVSGNPAGHDHPADGIQVAYHHVGGNGARVYWDSPSAMCGAVVASADTDLQAATEFWHNGA